MRVLLSILAIIALLLGAVIFSGAQSAIHEIEALLLFLIFAVFTSGAGIVDAINKQSINK